MPRKPSSTPTEVELEILQVLWQRGPSTVKDVHQEVRRLRATRLTTTLKQMQVMTAKGILRRDDSRRPQVYCPRFAEERTLRQLVGGLLDRAFGGSAERLVMHALATKKASPDEIARIRKALDRFEEGGK